MSKTSGPLDFVAIGLSAYSHLAEKSDTFPDKENATGPPNSSLTRSKRRFHFGVTAEGSTNLLDK
jgi:hypothetical protein